MAKLFSSPGPAGAGSAIGQQHQQHQQTSGGGAGNAVATSSSSPSLSPSEHVIQQVERHLGDDSHCPSMRSQLRLGASPNGSCYPTVSGLQDADYPTPTEFGLSPAAAASFSSQMSSAMTTPLPSGLRDQLAHLEQSCDMGFFSEIGRAWLTIDSNIYLWKYDNAEDLAYYDCLNEVIVCVGLVKPKAGIFKPHIKYLLVLCTTVEIVLLGVTFSGIADEDDVHAETNSLLLLLPDPVFTLPTDNQLVTTMASTESGRIFLACRDGHLYEVMYQAEEGWFTPRCRKVNLTSSAFGFLLAPLYTPTVDPTIELKVDSTRAILYGRTERGQISVYDLGAEGEAFSRATTKSMTNIANEVAYTARSVDASNFKSVIALCPVAETESLDVHLVAITQTGVRLYFTTVSSGGFVMSTLSNQQVQTQQQRPNTLSLVHIRLPPGFTASSPPQRPTQITAGEFRRGTLVLVSAPTNPASGGGGNELVGDRSFIWALNSDPFAFEPVALMELHSLKSLTGTVWRMTEEVRPDPVKPFSVIGTASGTGKSILTEPPTIVTQHMESTRKFVFLSNQGVHIIHKLRPMDHLKQLLIEHGPGAMGNVAVGSSLLGSGGVGTGVEAEAVRAFFRLYGDLQAVTTALALACTLSSSAQDSSLREWATMAFFSYGGDAKVISAADPNATLRDHSPFSTPAAATGPHHLASTPFGAHQQPFGLPSFSSPIARNQQSGGQFNANVSMSSSIGGGGGGQPVPGTNTTIEYSVKHQALYLYFSRILRPVWNMGITRSESVLVQESSPTGGPSGSVLKETLLNSISKRETEYYVQKLMELREFIAKNFNVGSSSSSSSSVPMLGDQLIGRSPSNLLLGGGGSRQRQDANLRAIGSNGGDSQATSLERQSILSLSQLINYTIEVFGLYSVLCDHSFHAITAGIEAVDQLAQLKLTTFKDLIFFRGDLAAALASSLVKRYIADNATTDAIARRLQLVCPTVFRQESAFVAKAHELLLHSRSARTAAEREQLVSDALALSLRIGARIDLPATARLFSAAGAYRPIVDLCLATAEKRDPSHLALHHYLKGQPEHDRDGREAYAARLDCYNYLLQVYEGLVSRGHVGAVVPRSPSRQTTAAGAADDDPLQNMSHEEVNSLADSLLSQMILAGDEVLHGALYDWLIAHNMAAKLLDLKSPHLETYLKRKTSAPNPLPYSQTGLDFRTSDGTDPEAMMDILWMYYERNGQYRSAAAILAQLAERPGTSVPLEKRIEYLSRAIVCMKSSDISSGLLHVGSGKGQHGTTTAGEYLHELQEKMDVARIQLQLYEGVRRLPRSGIPGQVTSLAITEALARLSAGGLVEISDLYDLAERLRQPAVQLAAIECAGLTDAELIKSRWAAIVDTELAFNTPTASSSSSSSRSSDATRVALEERLTSLGKVYYNSGGAGGAGGAASRRYFPAEFLIRYVEYKTHQLDWDPGWLPAVLTGVGMARTALVDLYHTIYKSREQASDSIWPRKSVHLLRVLSVLLDQVASAPQSVPIGERRAFLNKCMDMVAAYLMELSTLSTADLQVRALTSQFRNIQIKLERAMSSR